MEEEGRGGLCVDLQLHLKREIGHKAHRALYDVYGHLTQLYCHLLLSMVTPSYYRLENLMMT